MTAVVRYPLAAAAGFVVVGCGDPMIETGFVVDQLSEARVEAARRVLCRERGEDASRVRWVPVHPARDCSLVWACPLGDDATVARGGVRDGQPVVVLTTTGSGGTSSSVAARCVGLSSSARRRRAAKPERRAAPLHMLAVHPRQLLMTFARL